MVERLRGRRAAAAGGGPGSQFGWEREAGREAGGGAGTGAGGGAGGGERRSGGAWAAAGGARRRGGPSARVQSVRRAPGVPAARGPRAPAPAACPRPRLASFSFRLHYIWAGTRGQALARSAAAAAPRGSPGQTPTRLRPPGPSSRPEAPRGSRTALRGARRPAGRGNPGRRGGRPGPGHQRWRGPAGTQGRFPSLLFFLFLAPVPEQPGFFISGECRRQGVGATTSNW